MRLKTTQITGTAQWLPTSRRTVVMRRSTWKLQKQRSMWNENCKCVILMTEIHWNYINFVTCFKKIYLESRISCRAESHWHTQPNNSHCLIAAHIGHSKECQTLTNKSSIRLDYVYFIVNWVYIIKIRTLFFNIFVSKIKSVLVQNYEFALILFCLSHQFFIWILGDFSLFFH